MNKVFIIGIAGGSGSGKSTVAVSLSKKYPDKIALLHIDDYFKNKEQVPILKGFTNWDHPDSIDFKKIYRDLVSLKNGNSVKVFTKSELYNPNYNHSLQNKIEYVIESKPVVILEGYLTLWDKMVRDMFDYKLYFDIPIEDSTKRRSMNKFILDQEYFSKVLLPMHKKYVEHTKIYTDLIIDVSTKSANEVLVILEEKILKL